MHMYMYMYGIYTVCICTVYVYAFIYRYIIAGMLDCPASGQFGTGMKRLTMPEHVRYWTKPMQSSIILVRYWTKIMDVRMPVPAIVSSMLISGPAMQISQLLLRFLLVKLNSFPIFLLLFSYVHYVLLQSWVGHFQKATSIYFSQ
jgi:hypothetical protein